MVDNVTNTVYFAQVDKAPRVDEDAGLQNVEVSIGTARGVLSGNLTIHYAYSGRATCNAYYTIAGTTVGGTGTVTATNGSTSVNIPVMIIDDTPMEQDEDIVITLIGGDRYELDALETRKFTLTIEDNDGQQTSFNVCTARCDEGASSCDVHVNLTMPALTGSPAVDYTVGGESSAR